MEKVMLLKRSYIKLCLLLALLLLTLIACGVPSVTINGTPVTSSAQATATALNVWNNAGPGVQVRYENWKSPAGDDDTVTIVRFDPHDISLSVGYQPDQPMLLSQWMQHEKATAIINGGYFDDQDHATALVVSNGHVFGQSYQGFGGMLSVNAQGTISLRSLRQQPYDPDSEQLRQATQSSPMLVLDGKRTQFDADASMTPRSVVATDKQGRLLFIVSPGQVFSLDELADQLVDSDLSIYNALNLDGGASTGLYVNGGKQHVAIDSSAMLPIVIIVRMRAS
ncbi:MAG TPA: phosphodiester glycosidase family protein [Ktedonobacteraceae bacterium]|jgi:exopolysaccharide biosynthesis protein|nr:phosphodiester glycosidase family protein [Ktedonobacteraceae bacterium]